MITPAFHRILIYSLLFLIVLFIVLGIYCVRKSQSYIGTGKVAEIEGWSLKATASWITTGTLTLLMVMELI